MDTQQVFLAISRLYGLVFLGFLLFQNQFLQTRVLNILLRGLIGFGFPLYSISRIHGGWRQALGFGWQGMLGFFLLGLGMVGFQFWLGRIIIKKVPALQTRHPRELLMLFALHNAGYLPLAFLGLVVVEGVMVYVFYYVMAFNVIFWTFSVPLLEEGKPRFVFRITPPLAGILIGLFLAITDWYVFLPEWIRNSVWQAGGISLDLILIVLGGSLSVIPFRAWRGLTELRWLIGVKLLAYPLAVLLLVLMVSRIAGRWMAPEIVWGSAMVIVVQASMPPATNLMIVTRRYGNPEQVGVIGGGMLMSYGVSLITLPFFLLLANLVL